MRYKALHLLYIAISLLSLFGVFACTETQDKSLDNLPEYNVQFYAKINAIDFTAQNPSYSFDAQRGNRLTLQGIGKAPEAARLEFQISTEEEGTFVLDTASTLLKGASYILNTSTQYNATTRAPGLITISKWDKENNLISGTFSFTGRSVNGGTVQVTNGAFSNVPRR